MTAARFCFGRLLQDIRCGNCGIGRLHQRCKESTGRRQDSDVLGRFSRLHLVLHEWNAKSWCRPRIVNTHDTESSVHELLVMGGSNGDGNQSAEGKGYVQNLLHRRERKAGVPVKTIENRKCE